MRIIAGTHRGSRIAAPKGLDTRPTGDRVREAAFNLIGPVEGDRAACRTIAENLERLRMTGARITCGDAIWALRQDSRRYDLVLVDPPYEAWAELEPKLAEHLPRVLEPHGLLVVETGSRTEPALPLPLRTSRRYGSARLSLFEPSS